ncbi:hypothetical protein LP419_39830 [Massilia sp. H-1]|nr:hypothetical protein LP419_39830 [Massilia sp. H-1]
MRALADGVFTLPRQHDLQGRYFGRGELIGYVIDKPELVARVVVAQDDADAVRSATRAVQVRLAHLPQRVLTGHVQREVYGWRRIPAQPGPVDPGRRPAGHRPARRQGRQDAGTHLPVRRGRAAA